MKNLYNDVLYLESQVANVQEALRNTELSASRRSSLEFKLDNLCSKLDYTKNKLQIMLIENSTQELNTIKENVNFRLVFYHVSMALTVLITYLLILILVIES